MAKKDRTGNRKTREQRKQFKVPELGYYLIVTDTEATERCFFTGLHQALPEDVRNKLVKPNHRRCARVRRCMSWWERLDVKAEEIK